MYQNELDYNRRKNDSLLTILFTWQVILFDRKKFSKKIRQKSKTQSKTYKNKQVTRYYYKKGNCKNEYSTFSTHG